MEHVAGGGNENKGDCRNEIFPQKKKIVDKVDCLSMFHQKQEEFIFEIF